jgi:hypothetical protein
VLEIQAAQRFSCASQTEQDRNPSPTEEVEVLQTNQAQQTCLDPSRTKVGVEEATLVITVQMMNLEIVTG